MKAYNWILIQLFAVAFNIDIPYFEVSMNKENNDYLNYFVCPSSECYPAIISYGKTTHNIDKSQEKKWGFPTEN